MDIEIVTAESGANVSDRGNLAQLYAEHAPSATRFAYLLTGDIASAEDLIQDAFVRAASGLFAVRHPEAFGAYLRKAILNLHRSRLRRVKVERAHLARETARRGTVTTTDPDFADRHDLWVALQRLAPRQRAAVILRYYEDQTERDTAIVLGCSVPAVKSMMQRALSTLREQMGQDDDD